MTDAGLEAVVSRLPPALVLNAAAAALAGAARTVRAGGAVAGALLGAVVLAFAGWGPYAVLVVFFVLGSALTRWGWAAKERRGVAEGHRGARGVLQVIANGAPAAALAVLYWADGGDRLLMMGYAGALAAASADTASSELGQVYGLRPVSLTSLKAVPVGTPGAVSGAGTAAGACAGLLIGLAAVPAGVIPFYAVPVVALAALAAAMFESLVATAVKGRGGHHALNFTNACAGAACAMGLWTLFS